MFMVSLFGLVALPLLNTFAGRWKARPTLFASDREPRPCAIFALVKTAEYRYPRPNPVEEFIFYDHPSVEGRVLPGDGVESRAPGTADPLRIRRHLCAIELMPGRAWDRIHNKKAPPKDGCFVGCGGRI